MKTSYTIVLSMLIGASFGATAIHSLRAQAKPPVYVIAENEVTDPEGYAKFIPLGGKALTSAGGRFIVRGGKTWSIEGAPPSSRVIIFQFDNFEQVQAAFKSPAYLAARTLGDKVGKFRIWAVEGLAK